MSGYSWNRRRLLQGMLAGGTTAIAPVTGISQNPKSVMVGSDRQLFFDDFILDPGLTRGIQRTLNRPHRIQRVMKPEHPAQALGFIFYCSAIDDDGTVKLFHGSYDAEKRKFFSVSTSKDGIHWTNPDLGLVEYQGSRQNNILPLEAVEAGVFLDPNAPPDSRIRLIYSRHFPDPATAGLYLASSPDGFEWKVSDTRLLPFNPDSQHCGMWDDQKNEYLIYTRAWNPKRVIVRIAVDDIEKPWPFDQSQPPHHIWGKNKVPTISREFPTVMATDERDPDGVQLYTNAVVKYPWAPNAYLAFPATYQTYNNDEWKDRAVTGNDGTFDIQFAASRDGISWTRWRQPYVPAGWQDGLDLRLVSMGQGLIRRGGELLQYFVGWPHTHGRAGLWDRDKKDRAEWVKKDLGGIYCAAHRVDGFVSMDAAYPGGSLTTRPIQFEGDRLRLNLHAYGSGGVKVALLNENGSDPLPGFSENDCDWINVDEIDHEVQWKGGSNLAAFAGKPIRVRFTLRNARLFAFQFIDSKLT